VPAQPKVPTKLVLGKWNKQIIRKRVLSFGLFMTERQAWNLCVIHNGAKTWQPLYSNLNFSPDVITNIDFVSHPSAGQSKPQPMAAHPAYGGQGLFPSIFGWSG
jgi:hypothetical protein